MDYYKAVVSFSGKISMHEGEVRAIESKEIIKDLTKAGYIKKLTKKEIEAMKVLGLILEEKAKIVSNNEETQDAETDSEEIEDAESSDEAQDTDNEDTDTNADEDVVTDEG